MRIVIPKENFPEENRIPILPQIVQKYSALGMEVALEAGLGSALNIIDEEFESQGAQIIKNKKELIQSGDLILRVKIPNSEEIGWMQSGSAYISFLDPFNEKDLIKNLAKAKIQAVSVEMIPRTTLAQKMDALSSQANLAGYASVILASERLNKILPMMMTPAGTIAPSKVFIIGVGVAGLQAIATARRLGARVEVFDTRPVVEEQVQSLGAKFVKIDLGEMGETKDGYAKALTEKQIKLQQDGMAKICSKSDIVITTALLFGRPAPRIVTAGMVQRMMPGSVIVDMAVESGGNVEGSVAGEEVILNGVRIIGQKNLPGQVANHASQMYANNLFHFVEHFWSEKDQSLNLDQDDEIIQGCLLTYDGQMVCNKLKYFL